MELKLTHESICINEVVFNSVLEQSVELDYLLPDYCQSIFKVLKCKIVPKINSARIMNGKLLIDGIAYIKVIYVSEERYHIKSVTQKQVFTKSVDLKEEFGNGVVSALCKCDYVNCRVVNQHRLDIRGAISIKTTISAPRKIEIISKACGMGVQISNKKVVTLGEKLNACKEFSIKEELELGYGKPCITEILDYTANAVLVDYKLIQNKVIIKGEILFHILYCTEVDEKPETMDFAIPISQIVDIMGINDDYKCVISFDVLGVEVNLKANGEGECKCLDAEFTMKVCAEANKNDEANLIDDIYSTGYDIQTSCNKIKIEQLINSIQEVSICKSNIKVSQNEVSCVYDIICDFTNESAKYIDGCIELSGNLNVSILALDSENMPIMIDKSTPCEMKIECRCGEADIMFTPTITIASVSYSMISNEEIEVRAEVKICGNLYQCSYYNVVSSIIIDEANKKERMDDAVLRLYFADVGEMVWDIAKRFNTSVDAILSENNLDFDQLESRGMLLIPIID